MPFKSIDYSFSDIPFLSYKDKTYVTETDSLVDYYHYSPDLKGFDKILREKKFDPNKRSILVDVLKEQNQSFGNNQINVNIDLLLNDNCYTVITAHQPTLFTGPLYYIIKILSAIKLTSQLKEKYPDSDFVPLFVSGGEDHDFEECNHLYLFNKKIEWDNDKGGAVGRLDNEGLSSVLESIKEIIGEKSDDLEILNKIESAINNTQTYGECILYLSQALFSDYGILVLSMDDIRFKNQMIDIFKDDVLNHSSFTKVNETQDALKSLNFKPQATSREINLFYFSQNGRNRIVKEDNLYKVLNTDLNFTESELLEELTSNAQNFSPNVVLRPIMQEMCVPNLAYVGGGGEIAYWLERRTQFEHYSMKMPLLIRRDSLNILQQRVVANFEKLGFTIDDIFSDLDLLKSGYALENTTDSLDIVKYKVKIGELFSQFEEELTTIDKSILPTLNALEAKTLKGVSSISDKVVRSIKRSFETDLNRIEKVYKQLYPMGKLMERHNNIIECFYLYGPDFIKDIYQHINPLDKSFKVLVEEQL